MSFSRRRLLLAGCGAAAFGAGVGLGNSCHGEQAAPVTESQQRVPVPEQEQTRPSVEMLDLLARMASALSESNAAGFLRHCDRAMPGYNQLQQHLIALVAGWEATSSVSITRESGNASRRDMTVDWALDLRGRHTGIGPMERRRLNLAISTGRRGKTWRVTRLEPVEFFRPPEVSAGRHNTSQPSSTSRLPQNSPPQAPAFAQPATLRSRREPTATLRQVCQRLKPI
jgi:hypothetical protein